MLTVDIALGHDGEGDRIVEGAEAGDLVRIPRLLIAELVAGEAQNHQPLGAELPIERFQPFILGSKTAATGHIDHQHHLARQLSQRVGGTIQSLQSEIGQRHEKILSWVMRGLCREWFGR